MLDASSYIGPSLGDFVRSASAEPLPTGEDAALAELARRGDAAAADQVIRHHLRIVVDAATRHRDTVTPIDDLVRRGVEGLLRAVRDYEPEFHGAFTDYARRRVRDTIRDAVLHH